MSKSIKLFYDFASPYSYIGFELAKRLTTAWKVDLHLRPMLLGGIFKKLKSAAPSDPKKVYTDIDLKRLCRYYHIPMVDNRAFFVQVAIFKGTLIPMRFITAIDMKKPDITEQVSSAIYRAFYVKEQDINEIDILRKAALSCGLDAQFVDQCVSDMTSDPVKNRLRNFTDEALDSGCFGAPWFVIRDERNVDHSFFGSERINVMADILGKEYPGPIRQSTL
ncbi:DgyrCDS9734 [Dimorphilus gyrociliatus]|uniref:Glutathione S-transferase kappa n=1 Tax=Dimorphilus gyrociliatus TaxID=2664684 RepID=A0A7I8W014_9ANNE|nr:DgyrCDS9734 [Dimorphilus gyrociliatus]